MTHPNDNTGGRWRLRDCLTVPGQPVGKGRPRFNRKTGKAYTPKATKNYENTIKWFCSALMIEGPVQVELWAIFERPQRLMRAKSPEGLALYEGRVDLDNVIKAINDGLQGRAFKNDRQVCEIHAFSRYAEKATPKKARTEIVIYEHKPTKPPQDQTPNEKPADMAPGTEGPDTVRSD
jgi:Holliday junction resolvase RusA-like endonuclease